MSLFDNHIEVMIKLTSCKIFIANISLHYWSMDIDMNTWNWHMNMIKY